MSRSMERRIYLQCRDEVIEGCAEMVEGYWVASTLDAANMAEKAVLKKCAADLRKLKSTYVHEPLPCEEPPHRD